MTQATRLYETSSTRLGSMMSMQDSLPRLPVPPLQQTIDKFLWSVRPLLSQEEYSRASKLVTEFGQEGGEGQRLQGLLEQRAKERDNWLSDWWLDVAYLSYRSPLPIHVNPSLQYPRQEFRDLDGQLKQGAKVIASVVDFKRYIDDQSFPLEKFGGHHVCMSQYNYLLCTCRIPGLKKDKIVNFSATSPDPPKHVIVMRNNHIFRVEVYSSDGTPLSINGIYKQLKQLVTLSEEPTLPIGILTAGHRDEWGTAYQELIKDPTTKYSLEQIHRSIFILSLDKSYDLDNSADTSGLLANMMNHGGGIGHNGGNRWYDKQILYILSEDGGKGGSGEHATTDGPPVAALTHHSIHYVKKHKDPVITDEAVPEPEKLRFHVTDQVKSIMNKVSTNLQKDIDNLHLITGDFTLFGKDFIKSHKMSPDSFFQVSLQLAYYRMYGSSCPTYESGSLRRFIYGRTETIRSCTPEARQYAISMVSGDYTDQKKVQLLREATKAHRQYTDDVINGKGIDRHLLGLRLIALEHGLPVPDFLTDPVYTKSTHWKLSTSQVPMQHGMLYSFGAVVPDGYGVFYNIQDDMIQYSISSWNSCPQTDSPRMAQSIISALTDNYHLLHSTTPKL